MVRWLTPSALAASASDAPWRIAVNACNARIRASWLREESFANAGVERVLALVEPLNDSRVWLLRRFRVFGFFI